MGEPICTTNLVSPAWRKRNRGEGRASRSFTTLGKLVGADGMVAIAEPPAPNTVDYQGTLGKFILPVAAALGHTMTIFPF